MKKTKAVPTRMVEEPHRREIITIKNNITYFCAARKKRI